MEMGIIASVHTRVCLEEVRNSSCENASQVISLAFPGYALGK